MHTCGASSLKLVNNPPSVIVRDFCSSLANFQVSTRCSAIHPFQYPCYIPLGYYKEQCFSSAPSHTLFNIPFSNVNDSHAVHTAFRLLDIFEVPHLALLGVDSPYVDSALALFHPLVLFAFSTAMLHLEVTLLSLISGGSSGHQAAVLLLGVRVFHSGSRYHKYLSLIASMAP